VVSRQVRRRRVALEVEGLGADPVQEGGRDRLGRRLVELLEVLREDRRRRGDVRPHVDEAGVERDVRLEVVDVDVDVDVEVDAVVGRLREVDRGDRLVLGEVGGLRPRHEVDAEEVDERAVLLVAHVAGVEDVRLDAERVGDGLERRGRRDRVGLRVVVRQDRHPAAAPFEDLRELAGHVLQLAGFERLERAVGDHRGGVDHHVGAAVTEFVLADGVGGAGDDVVVAADVANRRDGRLVRLHVAGEHQHDVAVGELVDDVGVGDVLHPGVEVLIAERLDATLVAVEDKHVFAATRQLFGDRVPDAATAEDRVLRPR